MFMVAFATEGKFEETVATLSALCAVPIAAIDRLMGGERPDPSLILCKALGYGWPTARAVIVAGPHGKSTAMDDAQANFDRLSRPTAQRVVRFWQARPTEGREQM